MAGGGRRDHKLVLSENLIFLWASLSVLSENLIFLWASLSVLPMGVPLGPMGVPLGPYMGVPLGPEVRFI